MKSSKKILLSGIKPTGKAHIGNYFGALKQWVDLQNEYETYIFIPTLHALTGEVKTAQELKDLEHDLVLDLLGIGIDPNVTTLWRQQDVPEVTELSWIFSCITTMPQLMRAHAFKDAEAKNKDISVGTFNYPLLMAADIVMYDTHFVPVGQDQVQHVEIAREVVRKFHGRYGDDVFVEPEALVIPSVAVVPGTDGQKMSKSYGNTIPLFGTDEEIKKAVMGIVTDSGSDIPTNVYAIHKLFKSESELKDLYEEKKGKYKDLKEALLSDILEMVTPMRKRREEYAKNPKLVTEILRKGAEKAHAKAQAKMELVRKMVGLK
jgi:tryptophanyl-tRNA synthetase